MNFFHSKVNNQYMTKRKFKKEEIDYSTLQPDELNELKKVALEFVRKMEAIDNEINLLKDDQKELTEEYKEKLDIKTLNLALKYLKIRERVNQKHTFDTFVEALTKEE